MKKKGFTLIELLAVVSIIALMAILAMPNIIKAFKESRLNVFVNDVREIMNSALTTFAYDSIDEMGVTLYYSSIENADLKTRKLDISESDKDYFLEIDRNGNFKRIVVYDNNFCYDAYSEYGIRSVGTVSNKSKKIMNADTTAQKIEVHLIQGSDVYDSGNDDVTSSVQKSGSSVTSYSVIGCEGIKKALDDSGSSSVAPAPEDGVLDTVVIDGSSYQYVAGMTWNEWFASSYNVSPFKKSSSIIYDDRTGGMKTLRNGFKVIYSGVRFGYADEINLNDQIVKGQSYFFEDISYSAWDGFLYDGDQYFDKTETGGLLKYNQHLRGFDCYMFIDGVKYEFEPEMTWGQWITSEYNTYPKYLRIFSSHYIVHGEGVNLMSLKEDFLTGSTSTGYSYNQSQVDLSEQILRGERYVFTELGLGALSGELSIGQSYYEIGTAKYGQEKKVYN